MLYRVVYRFEDTDGSVQWARSSHHQKDMAAKIAQALETRTGYPADVEPEDRPKVSQN